MNQTYYNFDPQLEFSPSGESFDGLDLNLPYRFFVLANPKIINPLFKDIFEKLESTKKSISKNDAWAFDEVIKIIQPGLQFKNTSEMLGFLIKKCTESKKIENIKELEKHILIRREKRETELFPTPQVYISRYMLCLLSNGLIKDSKSFFNDKHAELFSKKHLIEKTDFENEMRAIFSSYYAALYYNNCSLDNKLNNIIETTWEYIIGMRLKLSLANSFRKLTNIMHTIYNKEFKSDEQKKLYAKIAIKKRDLILDVLFKTNKGETLEDQKYSYQESFNTPETNEEYQQIKKFAATNLLSAKDTFLLIWAIDKFCEYEPLQNGFNTVKDIKPWFEDLTKRFFTDVKNGLDFEKAKLHNTDLDFCNHVEFIQDPHSEIYKTVKELKDGSGRKIIYKKTDSVSRENPSVLEFLSKNNLLSFDNGWCLEERERLVIEFEKLLAQYKKSPSDDLLECLGEIKKKIISENQAIYDGAEFYAFLPECLNEIQSEKFIPQSDFPEQNEKDNQFNGQYKIDFDNPVGFEYKSILLKKAPLGEFKIMPDYQITDVKFGESITYNCYTNKDGILKKDWFLNQDGIFETVNTLIENPISFQKKQKNKKSLINFESDCKDNKHIDFDKINSFFIGDTLIRFLNDFLKGGKLDHNEYKRASLYPDDTDIGDSFSYNIKTGKFADFAADQSGRGVISLVLFAKRLNKNNKDDLQTAAKILSDWANDPFESETYQRPTQKIKKTVKSGYFAPPAGTPEPTEIYYKGDYVKPAALWPFTNKNGNPITYDCRINLPNGKKDVMPVKWGKRYGEWKWITGAISNFKPLYKLHLLKNYEVVYIGEGCKTADAIQFYIGDKECATTWQGGTNAIEKTDWSQLKGKKLVIIFPDADAQHAKSDIPKRNIKKGDLLPWDLQPGQKAALKIAKEISQYVEKVIIVYTEEMAKIKSGWDTADAKESNWGREKFIAFRERNAEIYSLKGQICYQRQYE